MNVLTPAEETDGWMLLFDGATKAGWHGYNTQSLDAWAIEDCALKTVGVAGKYGSDKRADLVSDREFTNYLRTVQGCDSRAGTSLVAEPELNDAVSPLSTHHFQRFLS